MNNFITEVIISGCILIIVGVFLLTFVLHSQDSNTYKENLILKDKNFQIEKQLEMALFQSALWQKACEGGK